MKGGRATSLIHLRLAGTVNNGLDEHGSSDGVSINRIRDVWILYRKSLSSTVALNHNVLATAMLYEIWVNNRDFEICCGSSDDQEHRI